MAKRTREEIAALEVGHTRITKGCALFLAAFFLIVVFLVPALEFAGGSLEKARQAFFTSTPVEPEAGIIKRINGLNKKILQGLDAFEAELQEASFLRKISLPPLQYLYLNFLGQGNEKVVPGVKDWLFFRPGIDALYGRPFLDPHQLLLRGQAHEIWEEPPYPDPLAAIIDFNRQLAARDIRLVVMPTPVKPSIEPEKISEASFEEPPKNRSFNLWKMRLAKAGVLVFDPRPLLLAYKKVHHSAYLKTDTHWSPGAMEEVATGLAAFVKEQGVILDGGQKFQIVEEERSGGGDIARMLTLPAGVDQDSQLIKAARVLDQTQQLWQPQKDSEILLMGDSFTNIYSLDSLGWGTGAGFAEHLSHRLGSGVDLIARNDGGAYVTRQMLATELARGRDRLAGKKLVIWQFAERELSLGNWKPMELLLGSPQESGFYLAGAGQTLKVSAILAAVSASPRPGSVPYRDNVITLHLQDLVDEASGKELGQAVVYGLGMLDNTITPLGRLRPGERVRLQLQSWDEMESRYGSLRRSPLEDEMLELELPSWGYLGGDDVENN